MNSAFSSTRHDAFPAGLRVLVVDDDSAWLRILEKMLKKCKYEVTTCCSATNALNLLREKKDGYDIVISDVNMPDMDGFKLLEHVGLEMDLPVIMMSVDGETSRVMKGVQHGACDYLLKPISMKELKNIWLHVFRKKIHEIREIESQEGSDGSFEAFVRSNGLDQPDNCRHLFSGDDMSPLKKRKVLDDRDLGDSSSTKKARVVWSVDLHQKFVKAVNHIGFDKVGPKKILDLMNVSWLTRENVASHLQKYRLYLSRLQKDNDHNSPFTGVMQDSPSKDPPGSLEVKKSMNMDQNEVQIHGYQYSGCSLNSHNDNRPSHGHNVEGVSSASLEEPKISRIRNNLESCVRRNCYRSLSTQDSETRFETLNRTLPALNSWSEAPRVQLKQEEEPQHFEDRYSKQHHIQVNVPQVPSINSTPSRKDAELVGSIDVKSLHVNFKNDQLSHLSSIDMSNQELHGQLSSAAALGWKTQGFDLSCISDVEYCQGNLLLGEDAISMPLDDELQYSLLYGNQNTELSEYYDPGLIAEVPIYFYDTLRFENWYS